MAGPHFSPADEPPSGGSAQSTGAIEHREPLERIEELLAADEQLEAIEYAAELHAAELAYVLEHIEPGAQALIASALDAVTLGHVLEYTEPHFRADLLRHQPLAAISAAIALIADDVATDVVQALDDETAQEVLSDLPPERRDEIARLLIHHAQTAGGRMTGQLLTVPPDRTASETIEAVRAARPDPERPFYLYVTDRNRRLLGVLNLRTLISAPAHTPVRDLARPDVITVLAGTDQEEAARLLKQYKLQSLPVVDTHNHLLGTIASDDLLDVLEEEATEDIFRMAGVNEDEDLRSVRRSIRHRLPWLSVNLITVLAGGWVVALFEDTLAQVAVLAAFIPVIAGHGGNAGIQTMTVVVRSLALGRLSLRDTLPTVTHELRTGLVLGMVTGTLVALVAAAWQGDEWLGLVVGVALLANVMIGVFFGALIPMALHRFKQDPALSGGVWVTTTTDVLGFLVYLSLATALIGRFASA